MKGPVRCIVLAILWAACVSPALSRAATLYQWVDKSGETRFGYRPPPGVVGTVVAEGTRQQREAGMPIDCRELREEQLRLIDKEIERVRALKAGFGPAYDFTPEAKQRFINDLLAHRAALITGRAPEEFAAPDKKRELNELKAKYQKNEAQLRESLEQQSKQLEQERMEHERELQQYDFNIQQYRTLRPGLPYPAVPY